MFTGPHEARQDACLLAHRAGVRKYFAIKLQELLSRANVVAAHYQLVFAAGPDNQTKQTGTHLS
jgi:hypothetical protein